MNRNWTLETFQAPLGLSHNLSLFHCFDILFVLLPLFGEQNAFTVLNHRARLKSSRVEDILRLQ